jgi:hypothetical protein
MPDVIVIEAGLQERNYWRDLWRYRELFYVLAWRDLAVRYKQTVIGAAWAVIRPVLTMVVFTVIFGRIAKLPSDGSAPYPLMVFAGMLPWTFFSTSLSEASGSLIGNANLISKVYFPRLIVPTATVVVAFADFLITFSILVAMMAWYRFAPGWQILLLPAFVLLASSPASGPVCGSQRSTSSTATSAMSSRSSCNSASTSRRLDSAQASFHRSGGCCIRSTRWSGLSTGFAGASWARKASFTFRASR